MLVEVACLRPEASKLCLVQTRGAGPLAAGRLDGALALFEQAFSHRETKGKTGERGGVSATVVTGIVGGIYRVIYERLRSGHERELPGLVDQIVEWMLLYDNPDPAQTPRRGKKPALGDRKGESTEAVSAGARPTRRAALAAYERGIERLMLAAEEPLRTASDWPAGVRAA